MSEKYADQLKQKARSNEVRGDVVLQVTREAWDGYFSEQAFVDALGNTGTQYPTVVVVPDGYLPDLGTLNLLIRGDDKYHSPGLLIVWLAKTSDGRCEVKDVNFLKKHETTSIIKTKESKKERSLLKRLKFM